MLKLFISQPADGLSDEEAITKRLECIENAKSALDEDETKGEDVYVLDSVYEEDLWYLGRALMVLSEADVAYFAKGWEKAQGCKIEHECAEAYGIKYIIEEV